MKMGCERFSVEEKRRICEVIEKQVVGVHESLGTGKGMKDNVEVDNRETESDLRIIAMNDISSAAT